ncbi:hypothetical protein GOODEAATRI_026896 [Goodea atripinnis]|uniref:Phosphatase and actin regulator n=1 Tax=Goodea atripinnis TaxID=208336 RepID=A0ABV0NNL2_9TELE
MYINRHTAMLIPSVLFSQSMSLFFQHLRAHLPSTSRDRAWNKHRPSIVIKGRIGVGQNVLRQSGCTSWMFRIPFFLLKNLLVCFVYSLEKSAKPLLQAKQLQQKKVRLANDLNNKIAHRPGPMELIHKNILPVDSCFKQVIVGKQY